MPKDYDIQAIDHVNYIPKRVKRSKNNKPIKKNKKQKNDKVISCSFQNDGEIRLGLKSNNYQTNRFLLTDYNYLLLIHTNNHHLKNEILNLRQQLALYQDKLKFEEILRLQQKMKFENYLKLMEKIRLEERNKFQKEIKFEKKVNRNFSQLPNELDGGQIIADFYKVIS